MSGQVWTTLDGLEHNLVLEKFQKGDYFWDTLYTWIPGHLNIPVCPWQWQLYLENWQNWKSLKINFDLGERGAVISLTFDFILTEEFVKLEERTNLATHIRLLFLAQLFFAFAFRLEFSNQFQMILLSCHLSRHSLQWHWRACAVHLVERNIIIQCDFFNWPSLVQ